MNTCHVTVVVTAADDDRVGGGLGGIGHDD